MATVYAKNPAELVIQNPTKPKKKMARRKRNKKGRFVGRKNPSSGNVRANADDFVDTGNVRANADDFVDTGKNLFLQFGLAALAATGVTKIVTLMINKTNLPKGVQETAIIAGPALGGIATSMFAKKNNAIAQGIAGGMVLSSVNSLSDKFIGGNNSGMADVELASGDLIIKADGTIVDQNGNAIARVKDGANGDNNDQPQLMPAVAADGFSTFDSEKNLLGDFSGGAGFESGEVWTP